MFHLNLLKQAILPDIYNIYIYELYKHTIYIFMFKDHVVWLVFYDFRLNILIWENSPRLWTAKSYNDCFYREQKDLLILYTEFKMLLQKKIVWLEHLETRTFYLATLLLRYTVLEILRFESSSKGFFVDFQATLR